MDRLTQESRTLTGVTGTFATSHVYNFKGDLTQMTYPSGRVVNFNYATGGGCCNSRLASVVDQTTNTTIASALAYNAAGETTSRTLGNGIVEGFGYNVRLQETSITTTLAGTTLMNFGYDYGTSTTNTGRVLARTDALQPEHSAKYFYDSIYRLGQVVANDGSTSWGISWTFDTWGNRLTQTPQGLAISKVGSQTLGYNNNRMTSNTYDAAGNQTNDGLHNYTFNGENQITQMEGGTATYAYDGEGRRIKKTVGSETTYSFYGVGGLLCEFTTTNTGSTQASSNNRTTYRTSDRLGTAVLLLMAASGTVLENNRTLPYGETWLPETGSANDKKFTTYQRDQESGLDYAMNRYNSSTIGRFLSADKGGGKSWMPQTLNRFVYAMNDPINYADADGNVPKGQCPYAQDDPCTPPPISVGSTILGPIQDAFKWQKNEIADKKRNYDLGRQYLQRSIEMLKLKGYSTDCENTLTALGTNSMELLESINGTSIADGRSSNVKYVNTLGGIERFIHNLSGDNRTVAQFFDQNYTWGYADANGKRIWIDSEAILNSGVYENMAHFLHELVHLKTNLTDGQIQDRLGLEKGGGSFNISTRLQADCVGTALDPR